ncbi:Hypothetical_protein [Hexamita inflata]|uniref:Hypothetical_protein n=1 Tax=Hexamita inflata TaxID=28002 RepID=A0AA86PBY1_9EUKA|nr:Hypothetical protein HINF_LOCUS20964 [Hexamita inflata]
MILCIESVIADSHRQNYHWLLNCDMFIDYRDCIFCCRFTPATVAIQPKQTHQESLAGKMVTWQVLLCRFISTIYSLSVSSRKYISTQLSFAHSYASAISSKQLAVILSCLSGTFDAGRFGCKTTVVENEIEHIGSKHQHTKTMVLSVE